MLELRRRYGVAPSGGGSRLPAGYQEVEYLEGTGTQYLITDIPANDGTDIEVDFQYTTYINASCLFGAYTSYVRWYFYWRQENQWNFGHGEDKLVSISNPYDRHIVEYITSSEKCVKIDGLVEKLFQRTINTELKLYIFWCNNYPSGPNYPCWAKIFSFKAKTADKEFNLIPCRRLSDNEKGMYDIVNDVFYTNAGTGEFLVGQDVGGGASSVLPQEYQLVEYVNGTGVEYVDTKILLEKDDTLIIDFISSNDKVNSCLFTNNHMSYYESDLTIIINYTPMLYVNGVSTAFVNNFNEYRIVLDRETYLFEVKNETDGTKNEYQLAIPALKREAYACILGLNQWGISSKAKIKYIEIKNSSNEPKAILHPCYRKSDMVAGFYDIINNEFNVNSADAGELIAGPDIVD